MDERRLKTGGAMLDIPYKFGLYFFCSLHLLVILSYPFLTANSTLYIRFVVVFSRLQNIDLFIYWYLRSRRCLKHFGMQRHRAIDAEKALEALSRVNGWLFLNWLLYAIVDTFIQTIFRIYRLPLVWMQSEESAPRASATIIGLPNILPNSEIRCSCMLLRLMEKCRTL